MAQFARQKGLKLLTTGDWTHPLWLREIRNVLKEENEGIFTLSDGEEKTHFMLSVEVSSIYSQGGKVRRIHCLIFSPSFETCEKINNELLRRGANLTSDGRPIVGIPAKNLLELVLSVDKEAFIIPCHVWTPWFSLYGSMSGFDSIDECFGEYSKEIFAIETGLSSDPSMNWRIKELDDRSIVSFSDAHSPMKMGREATAFDLVKLSYKEIKNALKRSGKSKISYTIEFYPEEGKYHYDGHRNCKVVQSPKETKENGNICPVCKRPLTVGVMYRVEELSGREEKFEDKPNAGGLVWAVDPSRNHPPFVKLVPLNEIIAEAIKSPVTSPKVKRIFEDLVSEFDSEMEILLKKDINELKVKAGEEIASAIQKVRKGDIYIQPGYDGEYGIVKISSDASEGTMEDKEPKSLSSSQNQLGLDF
ncbi:MAG: DNA helicase UvrD [Candidatus Levybacteria bacterium]|nr:DNA helicase UvrD [Candidatus Levybacteria bacterium]